MNDRSSARKRLLTYILIAGGAAAVGVALAADALGFGGYPGLGPKQIVLALAGAAALLVGVIRHFDLPWRNFFEDDLPVRPAEWLGVAATLGICTGLIEVAVLGFTRFYLHKFIYLSEEVIWMAPLADGLLFCAVALFFLPLVARRSSLATARSAFFLFLALGIFSLLLMFPTLHFLASLVLAIGLSVRLAPTFSRHKRGAPAFAGRGLLLSLLLVLALSAVAYFGANRVSGGERGGSGVEARPNVLLIVLDTVRARDLSLYGYDRPTTPNLLELAKSSAVFDNAIATAPWTLPSHASMFTGYFHHDLSVAWARPLDADRPTLAEEMAAEQYMTGGFVANYNYCGYESGLERGFAEYVDYPVTVSQLFLSASLARTVLNAGWFHDLLGWYDSPNRKSAEEVNAEFLSWQAAHPERPFFAFLNYYDAHQPYMPPRPFRDKFGPTEPRGQFRYQLNLVEVNNWYQMSATEIQSEKNAYDASIAYIDYEIGRLVKSLETRGVLENTILIITSDHGELFGEGNLYSHGSAVYMPAIRVPLLIRFPKATQQGHRVAAGVTLRNLPRTIFDLADFKPAERFPGHSLRPYWQAETTGGSARSDTLLSEVLVFAGDHKGYMKSILFDRFHYIRNGDGYEELYDLVADAGETNNLAGDKFSLDALERGRAALRGALGAKGLAEISE